MSAETATPPSTSSRYARQAVLGVIGHAGQAALARSTVLVVGCGALGGTQAELLARAGVGRLILVDRDVLELHNLQRQLLFDEQDVRERMPKAAAAARRLRAINSEIVIEAQVTDVTATNVAELMRPADLVIDGTDNFETRYVLNDAAVQAGKPWVYGGVLGTDGTVMAVRPGLGPCLRCIFPDPPDAHLLPTCETQGVLNTAVVWIAALQVTEAIKLLVRDCTAEFRLTALDVWHGTTHSVAVKRNDACVCCVERRFEFLSGERGSSSTVFCGRNAVQVTPERRIAPDFSDLSRRLAPLGKVTMNGLVLEFTCEDRRMVVFPDGRVLVMGTTDTAEARSLVAKYVGS
ncbi:MAG: thiazole biosynthesis adenylyltransferase ThiF [Deltaproteobacteria bacterium]|nr:thiazole biosynthesis adenylyltransferase ThiF [Deltaproteobacteria bacterium]